MFHCNPQPSIRGVCTPTQLCLLLALLLLPGKNHATWADTLPDSPRAAMQSFLSAMRTLRSQPDDEQAWRQALDVLDFSSTPLDPLEQREAAWKLLEVLERIGPIDLETLPDADQIRRLNLTRYRYFPRHPEHDIFWERIEGGPEGLIILEYSETPPPPAWRFSSSTIQQLDKLYLSMLKLPKQHRAPHQIVDVVAPTWQRTTGWGWLGLLVALFLGAAAGKLAASLTHTIADRLERRGWSGRATAFHNAASPLSLSILTFGLAVGLQFIYLEEELARFAYRIIQFLYIFSLGWFLYNLIDIVELALMQLAARTPSKLDDMLVPLIRKTLRVFLVIIFALLVAQNVFGLNITSWLAGLGIAGLAVSLAAQDSVKNLFGSITVFLDHPFAVGDRILFDGIDGTVEEIGFRSTKVRTLTGHLVTIPNMKFIDGTVENVSRRPNIRRILDVTIPYDTPPEKVQQALTIIRSILAEPQFAEAFDLTSLPPRVYFNEFNPASLNIRVIYWYILREGRDWWSYNDFCEKFNMRLLREFNAAGIEFAFPTQTLFLAGDPNRRLNLTLQNPAAS